MSQIQFSQEFIDRFWSRVEKQDQGCWLWTGRREWNGYGRVRVCAARKGSTHMVTHRVSYLLHYGHIEAGMNVLHHCDVPACVNPAHLYAGTQAENMADRGRRGRGAKTRTFLNPVKALEIRRRYAAGGCSQVTLAREYGVTIPTINWIVNGRSYKTAV
jgi:hypothetical protein